MSNLISNFSNIHVTGAFRNILLGGGLCYSIEKEKYWHIPIILLSPSIYAGYNLYNNKDSFKQNIKDILNNE